MASTATFKKQTEVFNTARTFAFASFAIESQMWACFQIDVTVPAAAISATIKAQSSANGGTSWVDIPTVTQALTVTGNYMFTIPQMAAPLVRLTITTANTNTGTVSVWGYAKGG